MKGVVKSMDKAKVTTFRKITNAMDTFEKQFDDLDISTNFMENRVVSSSSQMLPKSEVDDLMHQVADEHGLEFQSDLNTMSNDIKKQQEEKEQKEAEEAKISADEKALEQRLRKLQGL